ncbi:MAG TPA: penicillin-binding protein 1C [Chthoniobacteraceae bacterium]|jgi:penicillin-binding protein 1C|nr:penicillin-binding protein 1C [Chthoniobacteraceae bacterium]
MKLRRHLPTWAGIFAGFLAMGWMCLPRPVLLDGISFSRKVTARDGTVLWMSLSRDEKYRIYEPLTAIAPEVVRATRMQEDRFYQYHPGINPVAVARSVFQMLSDSRIHSGASTISMQVARLRYHLKTRSIRGKLEQMYRAIEIERYYSKAQIMEAYLNLAPYGGNIEGIEAASEIYFAKPASQLTLPEAAALCVIPQNPVRRGLRLGAENPAQIAAQNRLLAKLGVSGDALEFRARRETRPPFLAPHFTRQVLRASDGSVTTTLSLDLQRIIEDRIASYTKEKRPLGVNNAAALLVDSHGMQVLAQVGSAAFSDNRIDGQVDCTASLRSPGSTLKPFIYALALEQGLIHPLSILEDAPKSFGGYNPENFDREFVGPIRATDALARSRNIPAITLASELANPNLYEFLQRAGINLPHDEKFYGLALPLGGAEVTMQDLAKLYGALANNGVLQPLQYDLHAPAPPSMRVLTPEAAFLTLEMLKTSRPDMADPGEPEPIFWKTGTSNGYRDAWCVAVFDHYILAVWLGNASGRGNPALIGRSCAAPLLFRMIDSMRAAGYVRLPPHNPPPGANLKRVEFCAISGALATPLCKHRIEGWFIPGISPIASCQVHREVYIDAATGMRVPAPDGVHETRKEIYEFWPDNLLKLFREAGLPRRTPPPYLPGSRTEDTAWRAGKAPRIVSPRAGAVYEVEAREEVTLKAETEAGVDQLYWFAGRQFIGKAAPREALAWTPAPGTYSLTAVDDAGRAGTEQVQVESRIR